MFVNNIVRLIHVPRYQEVGSGGGSTACAALYKNSVRALCIDNWSEFGGPKDTFFSNINSVMSENIDFDFIEADFRSVDASSIGKFNIYLFDGPHEEKDQYDGLKFFEPALDPNCIFIVDDWNWDYVRRGTFNAVRDAGYNIDASYEIRTTQDNSHAQLIRQHSDWHNGYFIGKLSRRV